MRTHLLTSCSFAFAMVFGVPSALLAQEQSTDQRTELIGLHHWTRQMIKDSLAKHVPGSDTTLSTHACGAEIKQLGFVRTAAMYYKTRIIVSVVEPQDSARVRNNPPIQSVRVLPEAWRAALQPHVGPDGKFINRVVEVGIKTYPLIMAGKKDSILALFSSTGTALPPAFDSMWTFLASHRTDADRAQALDILQNDSVVTHRTLAIGVLANFPQRDEVWGALMHTIRDRNDVPGAWLTAQEVMTQWVETGSGNVDWAPRAEDVRALLAGANLWALPEVLKILTRTKIDPSLAKAVLARNAVFVLGYASSGDPQAAKIGQNFLAQLSGRKPSGDLTQWQVWTRSLEN